MAEKVGDGYVEVGADVDERSVRRASEKAADAVEDGVKRRRLKKNIFTWLFTPNPAVLQALRTGIPAVLSSPIGLAAIALAGTFAVAFVGAVATTLLTAGLGAAFLAAGTVAMFAFNKRLGELGKKTVETLKKVLTRAAQPLVKPLEGALRLVERAAKRVEPILKRIFAGLAPSIKPLTQGLIGLVENALPGLERSLGGIQAVFRALGEHLPKLGTAIGDFFAELTKDPELLERVTGTLITWVRQALKVAGPLLDGLTVVFGAWVNGWRAFRIILEQVKISLSNVTESFDSSAWQQVTDAFKDVWDSVKGVWQALRELAAANTDAEIVEKSGALVRKLKELWDDLVVFLKQAWNWAWGEIKKIWNTSVEPWLKDKVTAILNWLSQEVNKKLTMLKEDAKRQAMETVVGIVMWFALLPVRILAAMATLPLVVARAILNANNAGVREAGKLVTSVAQAIGKMPKRIASALAGVASSVTRPFRGAGSWLYNAGVSIIQGLINGIRDRTPSLGRAVGNAAALAASYVPGSPVRKGPLRVLNHGYAGKQIIKMLEGGIFKQLPSLRNTLDGLSMPMISAPGGFTVPAGFTPTAAQGFAGVGSISRTNTQNFYITTQEIDPRRHAAELGFELEGRIR